jgi:hypothetical protein
MFKDDVKTFKMLFEISGFRRGVKLAAETGS